MHGQKPGLKLLMHVWRGEYINWDEIAEQHMPKTYCPGCYLFKLKPEYNLCGWNKDQERGNCKTCIARRTKEGSPYECNACCEWLCAEAFEMRQRDFRSTHTRICISCLETRKCVICNTENYKTKIRQVNGSMHERKIAKGNAETVLNDQQNESGIAKVARLKQSFQHSRCG